MTETVAVEPQLQPDSLPLLVTEKIPQGKKLDPRLSDIEKNRLIQDSKNLSKAKLEEIYLRIYELRVLTGKSNELSSGETIAEINDALPLLERALYIDGEVNSVVQKISFVKKIAASLKLPTTGIDFFIAKHHERFESFILGQDCDFLGPTALELLADISESYESIEDVEHISDEAIARTLDIATERIKVGENNWLDEEYIVGIRKNLGTLRQRAMDNRLKYDEAYSMGKEIATKLGESFGTILKRPRDIVNGNIHKVSECAGSGDMFETRAAEIGMRTYLSETVGFTTEEAQDILNWWDDAGNDQYKENDSGERIRIVKKSDTYQQNLETVIQLAEINKDILKGLYHRFGIRNFGRYPVAVLKKQFEEQDEKGPFGVMFAAAHDHNTAFFGDKGWTQKLSDDLGEFNGKDGAQPYKMRIYEVETKQKVIENLFQMKMDYEDKPCFVVLKGHGSLTKITLSNVWDKTDGYITVDDFANENMRKGLRSLLGSGTIPLILNVCNGNSEGTPGREMLKLGDIEVHGANDKGNLVAITVYADHEGNLKLSPLYTVESIHSTSAEMDTHLIKSSPFSKDKE